MMVQNIFRAIITSYLPLRKARTFHLLSKLPILSPKVHDRIQIDQNKKRKYVVHIQAAQSFPNSFTDLISARFYH